VNAPKPRLTADQRRRVERARQVTGMSDKDIAARSCSSISEDLQATYASGYRDQTIRGLLRVIDELTGETS